jgi:hypothetical protein
MIPRHVLLTLAALAGIAGPAAAQQQPQCNPGFVPFGFGMNATWLMQVNGQGCAGEFSTSGMITASSIVQPPANGSAFIQFASYGYTPNPGFSGQDQFVMSISGQGGGLSGTSTVTVQVTVQP